MYTYTLKKNSGKGFELLNKEGKSIYPQDLLNVVPNARVFALDGVMGAGKTTFIKMLCESLGCQDIVNSPTFAIVNVYEIGNGKDIEEFYHFDCYRLKNTEEAIDMGAEEYLQSGNYCFIEWPDILKPILPTDTVWMQIEPIDADTRILRIKK